MVSIPRNMIENESTLPEPPGTATTHTELAVLALAPAVERVCVVRKQEKERELCAMRLPLYDYEPPPFCLELQASNPTIGS